MAANPAFRTTGFIQFLQDFVQLGFASYFRKQSSELIKNEHIGYRTTPEAILKMIRINFTPHHILRDFQLRPHFCFLRAHKILLGGEDDHLYIIETIEIFIEQIQLILTVFAKAVKVNDDRAVAAIRRKVFNPLGGMILQGWHVCSEWQYRWSESCLEQPDDDDQKANQKDSRRRFFIHVSYPENRISTGRS